MYAICKKGGSLIGKDLQSKNLLNCADVFADIGNVNLFNGEELLCADGLELQPTELTYKNNFGIMHHHFLDTRMKAKEQDTDIAIFCIENQNEVSNIMPVRDMGYLYSNYNEQLRQIRQKNERNNTHYPIAGIGSDQKLTPVISLILYYGNKKWSGPEKLSDMLAIPEKWRDKLLPWITEHPIHVINLKEQDESVRAKYKSDFRHVVDFFACLKDSDKIQEYVHDKNRVVHHPEEYLDLMAAISGERRFTEIKENILKKIIVGKEGIKMDGFFDLLEKTAKEDGIKQGISQGMSQGISQGKQEIIGIKYTP